MEDIFEKCLNILVSLPFLLLILAVHEYGHYLVARCFGVRMSEFSLGQGKAVWQKTTSLGVHYIIRRYPISAHVSLNNDDFNGLSFFQKTLVIIAGPIFNLISAFIVFALLIFFIGFPSKPPVFNAIEENLPAFEVGLKHGDRITAVNGQTIERYGELLELSYPLPVKTLSLTIDRNGEIFETDIQTIQYDYISRDGLVQSHGRLGVLNFHGPMSLEVIKVINDIVIEDEEQARDVLLQFVGQDVEITIESGDDKQHKYHAWLDKGLNDHLNDPEHDHYDEFYLGKIGDHFYLERSFIQSIAQAATLTLKMISDVASIPYQLFPVDKKKVKPETRVYGDETVVRNWVYKYGFFTVLASIIVGLVNLLPIPYFDGGQLVVLIFEQIKKRPITPQEKFYLILILLGGLYLTMLIPNANNMPNYVEKQTKKMRELIDDTF